MFYVESSSYKTLKGDIRIGLDERAHIQKLAKDISAIIPKAAVLRNIEPRLQMHKSSCFSVFGFPFSWDYKTPEVVTPRNRETPSKRANSSHKISMRSRSPHHLPSKQMTGPLKA
tara:strand:- start:554 stop:898 length:345 start_codon:yes stop_codon:yes gene_type:complete